MPFLPSEDPTRRPNDPLGGGGYRICPLVGGLGVSDERSESDLRASEASEAVLGSYRLMRFFRRCTLSVSTLYRRWMLRFVGFGIVLRRVRCWVVGVVTSHRSPLDVTYVVCLWFPSSSVVISPIQGGSISGGYQEDPRRIKEDRCDDS